MGPAMGLSRVRLKIFTLSVTFAAYSLHITFVLIAFAYNISFYSLF